MKITLKFCGAVRTVTGSTHLLEADGQRIVIDAGLFQGHREDYYRINSETCFNPRQVDAVVISHSHIDHCGNLPSLIKKGLKARVFLTPPTKALSKLMLLDSARIQEEDIKFVNKINASKGLMPRQPLYETEDVQKSFKKMRAVDYQKKFKLTKGISCIFYNSGHILGSAIPLFEAGGIRLAYAVDLGRYDIALLPDPDLLSGVDYLIIESTYGGRTHEPASEAQEKLADTINRTVKRGGKIIIPAFALERTQEVVYYLGRLIQEKKISPLPIYVDSPLACDITDIFADSYDYFDSSTKMLLSRHADPFGMNSIHYIRNAEESKQLNFDKRPMIIISTSGMCESGRILHHLRNNITDSRNTILVVGYMAKNTLGKRLVDRRKRVKIFGESFELKAKVEVINAFSAHADKNELVDYVRKTKGSLKKIFIVHGDIDQSEALCQNLKNNGFKAYIPKKYETVELI